MLLKSLYLFLITIFFAVYEINCSEEAKHPHDGLITPFTGKHIKYTLTTKEEELLNTGKGVTKTVKSTSNEPGGIGFAVQDVNAPIYLILDTISDLTSYPKYVPSVKKVDIYDSKTFYNGTTRCKAKFDVRVFGVSFRYFLDLTKDTKRNTYTWTLDYNKKSDFNDNVGHWQVEKHPSKGGWSRVMYSTDIRLPSWIPSMVINFLTKTAILESTQWVKEVSEKSASTKQNKADDFAWGLNADKGGNSPGWSSSIFPSLRLNYNNNKKTITTTTNNDNNIVDNSRSGSCNSYSSRSVLSRIRNIVFYPFRSSRGSEL